MYDRLLDANCLLNDTFNGLLPIAHCSLGIEFP